LLSGLTTFVDLAVDDPPELVDVDEPDEVVDEAVVDEADLVEVPVVVLVAVGLEDDPVDVLGVVLEPEPLLDVLELVEDVEVCFGNKFIFISFFVTSLVSNKLPFKSPLN